MAKKIEVKQKTARKRAPSRSPEATAPKKTPSKKTPTKTVPPALQKSAVPQTTYQFDVAMAAVPRIVESKARRSPSPVEFASFEEAKDRAIDFLIDFIADCERELWDLKRADSYEAYTAFLAAAECQKV